MFFRQVLSQTLLNKNQPGFGWTLYFRFEVLSQIDTTFLQTPTCGFVCLLLSASGLTQQFSFIKQNIFCAGFAANIISQNQTGFGGHSSFIFANSFSNALQATRGLAKCGLDGRTINSKTLIGFSSGLTLIIKRQMLSSTIKL